MRAAVSHSRSVSQQGASTAVGSVHSGADLEGRSPPDSPAGSSAPGGGANYTHTVMPAQPKRAVTGRAQSILAGGLVRHKGGAQAGGEGDNKEAALESTWAWDVQASVVRAALSALIALVRTLTKI